MYGVSDSEDDEDMFSSTKKASPKSPLDPGGGKVNPAFVSDEQALSNAESGMGSEENGSDDITESSNQSTSLGDRQLGNQLNVTNSSEDIDLAVMGATTNQALIEMDTIETSYSPTSTPISENYDPSSTNGNKNTSAKTAEIPSVPDVSFAGAPGTDIMQSITAVVHSSKDGNFEIHGPLDSADRQSLGGSRRSSTSAPDVDSENTRQMSPITDISAGIF